MAKGKKPKKLKDEKKEDEKKKEDVHKKEDEKKKEVGKKESLAIPKFIIPFYTKERWQNWINQAKDSNFKIDDQEKSVIFVNMVDDVILACLKLIAKYDNGLLQKDEAIKYLSEIKEIVLQKIDSINDDIDMMLESTQLSLMGVFASCERYIEKNFEKTKSFEKLIKNAIKAEEENNMPEAMDNISLIGANVLVGEKLKDSYIDEITSDGLVAEWLDGIDSMCVAMMGDTSYKHDEPDSDD